MNEQQRGGNMGARVKGEECIKELFGGGRESQSI